MVDKQFVVITKYCKIYKVMSDNIWATPQVFNTVHPRLGGLSSFGGVYRMFSGKTFR